MALPSGWELTDALEAAEAASPVDAVGAVTASLADSLGTDDVSLLIADLAGRALVRLGREHDARSTVRRRLDGESADTVPLSDAVVSEVLVTQSPVAVPTSTGWRLLAPVSQRGEVLGLLEVLLGSEPDAETVQLVRRTAHVLSFVVIANRRHTDLFEWGQRTTRFELSAEIQRRLLPAAYTCEAGELTLSAWLEPAATIGGDTFDYSRERDKLHLSMTDAMGHGVSSALTASLCVAALRNSRRAGVDVRAQAVAADEAVHAHARNTFVTGLLGRVDLRTGVLDLVNAGHVPPLLLRDGVVSTLDLPVDLPFGLSRLNADAHYRSTPVQLQPGDRLVFVTDGMLDRRAAAPPLAQLLQQTRALHPREATRRLADDVLRVAGPHLADDATLLLLDWHGQHRRRRDSRAGADRHLPDRRTPRPG